MQRSFKRTAGILLVGCFIGALAAYTVSDTTAVASLRGMVDQVTELSGPPQADCEQHCPPGFFFTPEGDNARCNTGTMGGHCKPCSGGTFQPDEGSVVESCTICPEGTYTTLCSGAMADGDGGAYICPDGAGFPSEAAASCTGTCEDPLTNCAPGVDNELGGACDRFSHMETLLSDGVTPVVPCS